MKKISFLSVLLAPELVEGSPSPTWAEGKTWTLVTAGCPSPSHTASLCVLFDLLPPAPLMLSPPRLFNVSDVGTVGEMQDLWKTSGTKESLAANKTANIGPLLKGAYSKVWLLLSLPRLCLSSHSTHTHTHTHTHVFQVPLLQWCAAAVAAVAPAAVAVAAVFAVCRWWLNGRSLMRHSKCRRTTPSSRRTMATSSLGCLT